MKILITGSGGFIAKNLIARLKHQNDIELFLFKRSDDIEVLNSYVSQADFIFHLAGASRPKTPDEFYKGNADLTKHIVDFLVEGSKKIPILFTSSIQSTLDNDYGKSKLKGESFLLDYSKKTNANIYIYRLSNVFGRWSKPNYCSVVATWCFNISRNLELRVDNADTKLDLLYIDDVIDDFLTKLDGQNKEQICRINKIHKVTLGQLRDTLNNLHNSKIALKTYSPNNSFEKDLYATYLSFLPDGDN